jgi:hypothetical protein
LPSREEIRDGLVTTRDADCRATLGLLEQSRQLTLRLGD